MNYLSSLTAISPAGTRSRQLPVRATRNRAHRPELLEELESRVLLSVAGPAAKLVIGVQPIDGYVGLPNAFALTVEVEDAGGNLVTTDTSKVKIALLSGPHGGLHGTVKHAAVAGIASFNKLVFSKPGTYTLQISDGTLTTTVSGDITIVAAPKASSLVFSQEPVGNPIGPSITTPITVDVFDQYGNSYKKPTFVSLKLVTGPVNGHIAGKLRVKTVDGTATFSQVRVTKGGSYVLEAKIGAVTMNSTSFDMGGPTIATTLEFVQQPTDTAADALMAPPVTVEVKDQFGNLLTTDHSRMKLKVASGLDASKTFTTTVKQGIATFSKLQYHIADQYTLQATDRSLAPVTSNSFVISAGAATRLAFVQTPANGTSHSDPSTIVVDVVDKFGNLVTGDTSMVTLAYAHAPHGTVPLNLSVSAVAGVASFSALTFPGGGRYILRAADLLLTRATSKSFTLI